MSKFIVLLNNVGVSIVVDEEFSGFSIVDNAKDDPFETGESVFVQANYFDGRTIKIADYGYYEDALVCLSEITEKVAEVLKKEE